MFSGCLSVYACLRAWGQRNSPTSLPSSFLVTCVVDVMFPPLLFVLAV